MTIAKNKRDMIHAGRSGYRLASHEQLPEDDEEKSQRLDALRRRRDVFRRALDRLLATMPLKKVTVRILLQAAKLPRYSLYQAFAAGLPSVFAYWATYELGRFADSSDDLVRNALLAGKSPGSILREWSDSFVRFTMEKPYGRLPIYGFLANEADIIGVGLVSSLKETRNRRPADSARSRQALDEFVVLVADAHRSGARLISAVQRVFIRMHPLQEADHPLGAGRLSYDDETWNLALSYWHSTWANITATGFLEAEDLMEPCQEIIIRHWSSAFQDR